jgi:hypothetical protein
MKPKIKMNSILITLIISLVLIQIEILYDISRFKKKLNDKPISTIVRAILIIVAAWLVPGKFHYNILLLIGSIWLLFDFALNVSRWNDIRQQIINEYVEFIKSVGFTYLDSVAHEYEPKFFEKLFYHGSDKKKWSYDWIMNQIPWYLELFIKLLGFITPLLMIIYDRWTIIDEIYYWIINLFR